MGWPFSVPVDFQTDRAQIFARAPARIFFGHTCAASMLLYMAWDVLPLHWIALWGFWEIIVTPALLYPLGKQAERAEEDNIDMNQWQNRLHGLFAIAGMSWGAFAFFGLDVQNPAHFAIQMAIFAAVSASAARSLGAFKFSFFFFEIPFAGLLAIRIIMIGGDFFLLGILVIIFMVVMCGLANDTSKELSDYLATKHENLDLAEKYRAAANEAERANVAKTQFLAQANHDLRQPIHAIGLLTECLRDQSLDAEGDEILDTIDTSVDNLATLFKSLLNITALDAGGLRPEISAFSLDELLRQTVRQAQPEANERGCTLKIVNTSAWVNTDKALLGSILQNLVFNAVKYAPQSKILVGVRVEGTNASVHVLDQGIGVPSHLMETVFEEFVRANPHGPGRTDGLGLGLSIVARTAQLLDLKVDFQSVEGMGTHVSINGLTITRAIVTSPSSTTTTPLNSKGSKILVIDDNQQVLTGMDKLLTKWGYEVTTCTPSEDYPLDADFLLTDFHLNNPIDGIELSKSIGQRSSKPIPTAIISGTMSTLTERRAEKEGFWTLHKPISPLQLRSVLLAMDRNDAGAET